MKSISLRARPQLEVLEDRLAPATFWVVNTLDNNQGGFNANVGRSEGSLRWAIAQANSDNVRDQIRFDIPGANPVITLNKALPDLVVTNPVDILGNTTRGLPTVTISGNGRDNGLTFRCQNATISSLQIDGCAKAQILIDDAKNISVSNNLIGTNAGNQARGGETGVYIKNSTGITIGNSTGRNVISGSTANVFLENSSNNTISGNYIGVSRDGTASASSSYGIELTKNSRSNDIGGQPFLTPGSGPGNLIRGLAAGIAIFDGSSDNQVHGNIIGLDKTGERAIGGRMLNGVLLQADEDGSAEATNYPQNNTIGGDSISDRNIISSALNAGIMIGTHGGKYNTVV